MGVLLSLLGSGLVKLFGSGLLVPILAHLDRRDEADLDRAKAVLAAEIEANRQRAAAATEFKPLVYLTALPFVIHAGAVMLDSTFVFGWRIPKAPAPFDRYEAQILLSFFVLSPVASLAKGVATRLSR